MSTYSLSLRRVTAFNPSNYRPIALLSCFSKAFETILNRKILKNLSAFSLLSDHQYGLRNGRSTGDLAFLSNSWVIHSQRFWWNFCSCHRHVESFWQPGTNICFLNYLPSDSIPLCTFIFSFLSGRSIAALVDGQCFTFKSINSGVKQCSVLSLTLFLLFINDLSITNCPLYSYADDSTLHSSTSFNGRPT